MDIDTSVQDSAIDPPEFRRDLVPEGATTDLFFSGRDGRGLTNEEYDEQKRRLEFHGEFLLGGE